MTRLKTFTKNDRERAYALTEIFYSVYDYEESNLVDNFVNSHPLTILRYAAEIIGITDYHISAGSTRVALITPRVTFKLIQCEGDAEYAMGREIDAITKIRKNPKMRKHFPLTEAISEKSLIQETIPNAGKYQTDGMLEKIQRLEEYFQVDDAHVGNFGWINGEPVFLDFEYHTISL